MSEKNPYENQETVDIPNFSSGRKNIVDTSSFKVDEEDYDDDDEYYDDEPSYRKVRRPVIIIAIILMVIMLGISVVSLISASKAKKQLVTLQEEYDNYVAKAKANESALNEKIAVLQAQSVNVPTPIDNPTTGDKYVVDVDQLSVRLGPGTDNDYTPYSALSDDIKSSCKDNDGNALTYKGASFSVIEIKTNADDSVWGKIGNNAWICLNNGEEDYCRKQ